MNVLVTGGAGYIGSHTCVQLLAAGHEVVVVDNFCNSKPICLARVSDIAGKPLTIHEVDLRNGAALDAVFEAHSIDSVIHFAGLKAVGESVELPLAYYENNVGGTLSLLQSMKRHGVRNIIFSSSATVYGVPKYVPIDENASLSATNPYGQTKLMIEEILRDVQTSDKSWSVTLLRYFNPVGAHKSGLIGEDPKGIPNNLVPYIAQVAVGKRDHLMVFGDDYDTPDGTGVRDYIHVEDLASGHIAALDAHTDEGGVHLYNLGTGRGISVLEMRDAFAEASRREIPYKITSRRAGDVATCYADASRAAHKLNWKATRGLAEMTADSWRWQSQNPDGFGDE
ncbi:MAG: UDP-glucose 4-epimerase GalE [Myxococcales bacterium]|nr:UDP-glucose 4-epimerase GalE [Myxococcales bacterium]